MAKGKKRKKLSEREALQIALDDHPEYKEAVLKDTLPKEIIGPTGEPMSPRMHLQIHAIVERQLAADEPHGIVNVAREMMDLGVSPHDVRHAIGEAISRQMWHAMKYNQPFDQSEYFADLREITDRYR